MSSIPPASWVPEVAPMQLSWMQASHIESKPGNAAEAFLVGKQLFGKLLGCYSYHFLLPSTQVGLLENKSTTLVSNASRMDFCHAGKTLSHSWKQCCILDFGWSLKIKFIFLGFHVCLKAETCILVGLYAKINSDIFVLFQPEVILILPCDKTVGCLQVAPVPVVSSCSSVFMLQTWLQ